MTKLNHSKPNISVSPLKTLLLSKPSSNRTNYYLAAFNCSPPINSHTRARLSKSKSIAITNAISKKFYYPCPSNQFHLTRGGNNWRALAVRANVFNTS